MGEKLSWSEAESVVRAYRAAHGLSSEVDVATLARTLGTDVAEVRRLAGRKPRFVDRSGALSAGLAFAVVALGAVLVGPKLFADHPARSAQRFAPPAPAAPAFIANGDLQIASDGKVFIYREDGRGADDYGVLRIDPEDKNTKL